MSRKIQYILIIFLSFCFSSVHPSYSYIKSENVKLEQSDFLYHPISIEFRYVSSIIGKLKENEKHFKRELSFIQETLKKLIYVKNKDNTINYNKKVLKSFKINLTKKLQKDFKDEKIKADLLILIKYVRMKSGIVSYELYKEKEDADNIDEDRTYIALLKINSLYDIAHQKIEDEFKYRIIRQIFKILGFRKGYLKSLKIPNNFDEVPYYIIKNSTIFKSYKKYIEFTGRKFEGNKTKELTRFYLTFWNHTLGINDIMSEDIPKNMTITELTINTFNAMNIYSFNECDLLKYKAGFGKGFSCLRPTQDCINETQLNNYFLEYSFYGKTKIKCFLSTKENIQNDQCGILYGNLINLKLEYRYCPVYFTIKDTPLLTTIPIPELDLHEKQTLRLIRNSDQCPKGYPRSVFFSVPPNIFDDFKNATDINPSIEELKDINKNVKYDVVEIKDKNFFVTYETHDDYYSRISVSRVVNYSGVIRSFSHLNSHNLLIRNPFTMELKKMGYIPNHLKIYSLINFSVISHKDNLFTNFKNMRNRFPNDFNYLPETYAYPEERKKIHEIFDDYEPEPDNLWLVKPKSGSLGEGIFLFQNFTNTPSEYLLMKYVSHPHLINNRKYDFRIYVLLTGLAPLRLYLYKEGITRFATQDYTLDIKHLSELYRHLTNISLNKKNKEAFINPTNADTEEGSKWSLKVYEKFCEENGIDYKYIRGQIADIAVKTILSVHDKFLSRIQSVGDKDRNYFHLFGFDFIVDENFKVYLLEVNDRPSLLMGDINDYKLKPQLVADSLNLIGIVPYSHDYKDNFRTYEDEYDNRIYKESSGNEAKINFRESIDDALCELGRPRGRFDLIFPVKDTINNYKKYLKAGIKENERLWEILFKE